jgi:hypothetical protein
MLKDPSLGSFSYRPPKSNLLGSSSLKNCQLHMVFKIIEISYRPLASQVLDTHPHKRTGKTALLVEFIAKCGYIELLV